MTQEKGNGKYLILAAIITGLATIVVALISKKEPTPPVQPNPSVIINNTNHLGDIISPNVENGEYRPYDNTTQSSNHDTRKPEYKDAKYEVLIKRQEGDKGKIIKESDENTNLRERQINSHLNNGSKSKFDEFVKKNFLEGYVCYVREENLIYEKRINFFRLIVKRQLIEIDSIETDKNNLIKTIWLKTL